MQVNVLAHEPHTALYVPDNDALLFYKAIAEFGKERLYPGGHIYVEINEVLGAEVVQLFETYGYQHLILNKDMQGKDRMVKATKGK